MAFTSPRRPALPRAAAAQPVRLLDLPRQLTAMRCEVLILAERAVVGRGRGTGRGRHQRRADRRRGAPYDPPVPPSRARRPSASPTTRCCCPAWSTPTCTSTSRAAPSGRASPAPPAPRRPAASRRSSTCRSTASRRPRRSRRCEAKQAVARGPGLRRRRVLGRRRARQPRRPGGRCTRPASSASSASCSHSGVEEFPPPRRRRARAPRWRRSPRLGAPRDRARRGRRRRSTRPRGRTGRGTPGSWPRRPDGGGGARHRPRRRRRPRDRRPGPRRAPLPTRTRCRSSRGRPGRGASRLSVETCPHYLTLRRRGDPRRRDASSSAARRSARPPTATLLWQALAAGDIDLVVSDHSPCTADLKRLDSGDFGEAWGGIASLQLGLPAVWTERPRARPPLADVVRWMATAPRRPGRAGRPGPHRRRRRRRPRRVRARRGVHRRPGAPAPQEPGRRPTPGVRSPAPSAQTWLRGVPVDIDAAPRGRLLRRGQR